MKNRYERPRCQACGTYLFNYDSKVTGFCSEHRTKLPDNYMKEFRKMVREKLGSPTATTSKKTE